MKDIYAIFDIDDPTIVDLEKIAFSNDLIEELKKVEKESDEKGWLTEEDIKKAIKKTLDKND